MDDFAQTGGQQDDLFDDFEEGMQTRSQDDLFNNDLIPILETESPRPQTRSVQTASPNDPTQANRSNRGGGRQHGNGPGREGAFPATINDSSSQDLVARVPVTSSQDGSDSTKDQVRDAAQPAIALESRHAPQAELPAEARVPPKSQSVRGSRSATGGPTRQKLTEEELVAKMQAARLKNANLEAAHARAEADAASFAQRENNAAKRKQEERRDRQQMMGEREKNRLRKLKAQGGREWDSEKREEEDHSTKDQRRVYDRGRGGDSITQARGGHQRLESAKSRTDPKPSAESFPALTSSNSRTGRSDVTTPSKMTTPDKGKVVDLGKNSTNALGGEKATSSWADMVEESKTA